MLKKYKIWLRKTATKTAPNISKHGRKFERTLAQYVIFSLS